MARWNDYIIDWNDLSAQWNDSVNIPVYPPQVEIYVNGAWTNISSYVRYASGIALSRGRSDWASQIDPGTCALTLSNNDGRFSPRNPNSPYYGSLGRNTPLRVKMFAGSPYLTLDGTSGTKASTPDTAALDITGDIDIQFEFSPTTWNDGTESELLGKWNTTGNQRSWYVTGGNTGTLTLHWSTNGTNDNTVSCTINDLNTPDARKAFRITLDVNNGSGGYTATFYGADSINSTWQQFEQVVTTSGTTSIFSSTANLEIGDISSIAGTPFNGNFYSVKILDGIGGTEVANPDFTAQSVGLTSFTDAAGRTWTLAGNADLDNMQIRYRGEVSEWPARWDTGGFDVTAPVQASGYFRRLKKGADPLKSAMTRALPSTTGILGYWPIEDGNTSTQIASGLASGKDATESGFTFAQDSSLASSSPLPTVAVNGTATFKPSTGTGGGWLAGAVMKLPSTLPASLKPILQVNVKSSKIDSVVLSASTTGIRLEAFDGEGTSLGGSTFSTAEAVTAFSGQWNQVRIYAVDSGSDVQLQAWWTNQDVSENWEVTTTITGVAPGNVNSFQLPKLDSAYDGMSIGHVLVVDSSSSAPYYNSFSGYAGEPATTRIGRVVREENIAFIVVKGDVTVNSTLVGPQRVQTLFDIIENASDADSGIFYEERTTKGVAYRDHTSLENQTAWLTLPYADVIAPLEPTDDDQYIQNDVTVTRVNGSSAEVSQDGTTDPLNTAEPGTNNNAVGRYAASYDLDLYTDDQCQQIAAWKVHVGTWDETRYPVVKLNLSRNPELIDSATRVDIGDRIQITNPPSWLPPGTIDLIVMGYKETIDQFIWTIEYNCLPYGPWITAVSDDSAAIVDTDGSSLNANITTTATSISVATQSGSAVWVDSATYSSDFPFDIAIGGERMTVTAITGTSSPQTFTVTRSVNGIVKAHSSGDNVALFKPSYTSL